MSLKSFGIAVLLTVMAATAVVAMEQASGDKAYSWRYKITVSVETPEGIKTGSAVREVHVELKPRPVYKPYPFHPEVTSKGEAVVVDLGSRGILFALTSFDDYRTVFEAFPSGHGGTTPPAVEYYSNLKNAKAVLEPGPLPNPVLVTFADTNDPKTIKIVSPSKMSHDFGDGVYLKSITIEMTDDRAIEIVDRYLPALNTKGGWDWLSHLPYGDLRRIGPENFK